MTKDTEEFSQFTGSVACREYALPRDESLTEPKGWIRGNTKMLPVLEVTTCCLQGKYGVEIRIESMNKDHSHSWVRISHGLNKLVTNLSNNKEDDNEQETSEMQFEDYALKSNVLAFASRSERCGCVQSLFLEPNNSARMTSEKDHNKHKTEQQLSQLKDRLDMEGVGTHGTSARLLPVLLRWAVHPVQAPQPRGLGTFPYSSTCTRLCSRPRGRLFTCVEQVGSSNLNTIKGQSKTTKTYFCQLIHKNTILNGERTWTYIEPQDYSLNDYSVSKKLINLLRHGSLPREDDGAIDFWRTKDYLQNPFVHSPHWSDEKWKSIMAREEEETRKYFSIVLILEEKFSTSELFKVIQDAILLILHYRTLS